MYVCKYITKLFAIYYITNLLLSFVNEFALGQLDTRSFNAYVCVHAYSMNIRNS